MYLDHTQLKEVLWLHKPSKTLIEGDYFSNLPAHEQYAATEIRADRGLLSRINNKLHRMGDNRWARRVTGTGSPACTGTNKRGRGAGIPLGL